VINEPLQEGFGLADIEDKRLSIVRRLNRQSSLFLERSEYTNGDIRIFAIINDCVDWENKTTHTSPFLFDLGTGHIFAAGKTVTDFDVFVYTIENNKTDAGGIRLVRIKA